MQGIHCPWVGSSSALIAPLGICYSPPTTDCIAGFLCLISCFYNLGYPKAVTKFLWTSPLVHILSVIMTYI